MIELKRKIPATLRAEVNVALKQKKLEIDFKKIQSIRSKIQKRLKIIENSHHSISRALHIHVKALYILLADSGGFDTNSLNDNHMTMWGFVAYFVDPMGVIPDHSIEDGYLDDAIAINITIRSLSKDQKIKFEAILNKIKNKT